MKASLITAVGLLLAGCATATPDVLIQRTVQGARGDRFGVIDSELAVATADEVTGERSRLQRTGQGARGVLFGHLVDVAWSEDALRGQVDGVASRLEVTREGGVQTVKGALGGRRVAFVLRDGEWSGTVANCRYELHQVEDGLSGTSSCQPLLERDFVVVFPERLKLLPLPERITYLAAALGAAREALGYDRGIVGVANSRRRYTQDELEAMEKHWR